jgi:hypothetical protein
VRDERTAFLPRLVTKAKNGCQALLQENQALQASRGWWQFDSMCLGASGDMDNHTVQSL